MKIYDKYIILKNNNWDKLYLFRCGNFYIFIDNDARFINSIIGLKITNFGYNVKCGFPINSLDKYMRLFNDIRLDIDIIDYNYIIKYFN